MDRARCPDCGHEAPAGAVADGLCPFCLLQLGLDERSEADSPWLDPGSWPCRVLNVLDVDGAMTSYLAEQVAPTRRLVVLTQLGSVAPGEPRSLRLDKELRRLVAFAHALVARVFGVLASDAGARFLVSEYVSGSPLVRYSAKAGADTRQRAALCLSVVEAIGAVHDAGLVHGRLRPDRVLVAARSGLPAPVVTGLGLSMGLEETVPPSADLLALSTLAHELGLEAPAQARQAAAGLAAWLRSLIAPTSGQTPR